MLHIGCHLSCSKGYLAMGEQALAIGADTFQFFTRNPRGSKAKELDPADAAALVALLAAVSMLRASGALDALTRLCAPVLAWLGIPPETAILMVVRPVSGSGALAAASDIIGTYGPDSRIGRTAAVMLGSTETTFYVLAVYFGACGVRRSRWAIPAAIAADLTGFLVAAALVRRIWGA